MALDEIVTSIEGFDGIWRDLQAALGNLALQDAKQTRNGTVLKVQRGAEALAIKFTSTDGTGPQNDDSRWASIGKEAIALQQLGPALTGDLYRDSGDHGTTRYLATRWMDGPSLARLSTPLRPDRRRAIAALCMDAMRPIRRLHQAGWVHGDLQPAHLLRNDGGPFNLIDFGWAKPVGTDNGYRGAMVHFASPRVATQMLSGTTPVDCTIADEAFSFFAVAFYCLYGVAI